jgi:hypothetical protein
MKHLKAYENIEEEPKYLQIGDIIEIFKNDNLYLVIDNVPYLALGDEYIKVVEIGYLLKNTCTFLHRLEGVKGIRFNSICLLGKSVTNLVYSEFEKSKKKLDNIKQKTGIDLFKNEKYLKWQFENDINKYNI